MDSTFATLSVDVGLQQAEPDQRHRPSIVQDGSALNDEPNSAQTEVD